ncbi:hypothetical protein F2P56_016265, partial [Juglans regia]
MGLKREVVVESKLFTLVKEGDSVCITEKGWKRKQELVIEKSTTQWLVKSLEACSSGTKQDFYSTIREGGCCYLAQKCYNSRGYYLVVAEYKEGGRRSLILIPEGQEGRGWRRVKEALVECVEEGSLRGGHYGGADWKPQVETRHSYKEALLHSRPWREENGEGGGGWTSDSRAPRVSNDIQRTDRGRDEVQVLRWVVEDLQGQMRNLQREMEDVRRVVGRNMKGICRGNELQGPDYAGKPNVGKRRWRRVNGPKVLGQNGPQPIGSVSDGSRPRDLKPREDGSRASTTGASGAHCTPRNSPSQGGISADQRVPMTIANSDEGVQTRETRHEVGCSATGVATGPAIGSGGSPREIGGQTTPMKGKEVSQIPTNSFTLMSEDTEKDGAFTDCETEGSPSEKDGASSEDENDQAIVDMVEVTGVEETR